MLFKLSKRQINRINNQVKTQVTPIIIGELPNINLVYKIIEKMVNILYNNGYCDEFNNKRFFPVITNQSQLVNNIPRDICNLLVSFDYRSTLIKYCCKQKNADRSWVEIKIS